MEVSRTPVDKSTRCDVWVKLGALPQRADSLLKKHETSNANCTSRDTESAGQTTLKLPVPVK